jgi:hypothetical protein
MVLRIGDQSIPFTIYSPPPVPVISAFQIAQCFKEKGVIGSLISLQALINELEEDDSVLDDLKELLEEFKDRFPNPLPGVKFANLPPGLPPDRGPHNHSISTKTDAQPFFRNPRRLTDAEYETLKEQIKDLLQLGHIQPSCSPWGAPILFV